eukprot:357886-Chlamydomonas_euryale.AAC.9
MVVLHSVDACMCGREYRGIVAARHEESACGVELKCTSELTGASLSATHVRWLATLASTLSVHRLRFAVAGGSSFVAAKVNEAKDILLGKKKSGSMISPGHPCRGPSVDTGHVNTGGSPSHHDAAALVVHVVGLMSTHAAALRAMHGVLPPWPCTSTLCEGNGHL